MKLNLYKHLLRAVINYGAETWCLSQDDCPKLRLFERRIYLSTLVNSEWEKERKH